MPSITPANQPTRRHHHLHPRLSVRTNRVPHPRGSVIAAGWGIVRSTTALAPRRLYCAVVRPLSPRTLPSRALSPHAPSPRRHPERSEGPLYFALSLSLPLLRLLGKPRLQPWHLRPRHNPGSSPWGMPSNTPAEDAIFTRLLGSQVSTLGQIFQSWLRTTSVYNR
jgi:hypothetical protein